MYIITPQCGITITRKTTFNKKIVSKQSWLTSIWKDSPLFLNFTDNFDLEDIKRESACRRGLSLVTVPCWWDGAVRTYASFLLSCSHLISLPPPLLDLRLRLHPSSPSYIAVCRIDQRWLSSHCYNSYSPCLSVYSWFSTSPSYLWPALTIVDERWISSSYSLSLYFSFLFLHDLLNKESYMISRVLLRYTSMLHSIHSSSLFLKLIIISTTLFLLV